MWQGLLVALLVVGFTGMGAVVAAPLQAVGTCLGGCCGSFLAAGCCKLAGGGSVDNARAARMVLLWLQAFSAALAAIVATTPERWLPWTCGRLGDVGLGRLGVCGCTADQDPGRCWSEQLVFRVEAACAAVFLTLLIMTVSGCAHGASRTYAVAKFMAIASIGLVSLFFDNGLFSGFGALASTASSIFLVAQAVLLIDFAYTWNETWWAKALACRRNIGPNGIQGYRTWMVAILVASALLLLGSVASSAYLYDSFSDNHGRVVNIVAVVIALLLLLVSITSWCEHGALLTSSVVMALASAARRARVARRVLRRDGSGLTPVCLCALGSAGGWTRDS